VKRHLHHLVHQHVRDRLHHATKPKVAVTIGVTLAGVCQLAGLPEAALAVSIFTNIVWIWE
jgi:hypothetical protein